jgi:hypothetical protein
LLGLLGFRFWLDVHFHFQRQCFWPHHVLPAASSRAARHLVPTRVPEKQRRAIEATVSGVWVWVMARVIVAIACHASCRHALHEDISSIDCASCHERASCGTCTTHPPTHTHMPTLHTQLTSALVSLLRRIRINDDISLESRLARVQDVVPHTHTRPAGMPRSSCWNHASRLS